MIKRVFLNFVYNAKCFLGNIWFPMVLVSGFVVYVIFTGASIKERLLSAFGGAFVGVMLGFLAEMTREGIKEFQTTARDRKIYLKLLEQDARNAHQTLWLYSCAQDASAPPEVRNLPPLEFELRYWSELSKDADFLKRGRERPFDKIFDIMWNFEKVNRLIRDAKAGQAQAALLAQAIYQIIINDKETKQLLLYFVSDKEVEEMESGWLKGAR